MHYLALSFALQELRMVGNERSQKGTTTTTCISGSFDCTACGDNRNFPFSWIYLNIFQSQVVAEHFLWWGRASRRKPLDQEPEKTATQQTERERDMSDRFNHISDKLNFAQEEENILEFWKEIDAFNLTLKLSEGRPEFTFYDGPPFATGLPHYGFVPFPPIFPFPPLKVC
jgi:hypothetical protein